MKINNLLADGFIIDRKVLKPTADFNCNFFNKKVDKSYFIELIENCIIDLTENRINDYIKQVGAGKVEIVICETFAKIQVIGQPVMNLYLDFEKFTKKHPYFKSRDLYNTYLI